MTKVITCYVHTSDKEDTAISAPFPGAGPVKCKPVVNWCKLVLELAKDFGLDLDFFKRHHVVELYSCGHDKEAEEVISTLMTVFVGLLLSHSIILQSHHHKHICSIFYLAVKHIGSYVSEVQSHTHSMRQRT